MQYYYDILLHWLSTGILPVIVMLLLLVTFIPLLLPTTYVAFLLAYITSAFFRWRFTFWKTLY